MLAIFDFKVSTTDTLKFTEVLVYFFQFIHEANLYTAFKSGPLIFIELIHTKYNSAALKHNLYARFNNLFVFNTYLKKKNQ